jgi:hypothetical protein
MLKMTLNEYWLACMMASANAVVQIMWFMYHQQKSQLITVIIPLPLGFRRISIIIACWHRLVWIQVLCYALHAIVLKWLWPTQEFLTSLMLTSMLEFWYGSFQSIFVWDESFSLVLTNVLCSSAGLWTGSREPCKFCIHTNYLSLVVTLAWCWNIFVQST